MGRKDTIKIFLRIRPDRDRGRFNSGRSGFEVNHTFDDSTVEFHVNKRGDSEFVNHSVEDYRYRFSRVFEPQSTQEEVFNTVAKDCVASALDGYNSTVFAYGQTGSGKTYSITGGTESYSDRGVIPRSISMIYEEIAKRTDYSWTVRISYMQIYNDSSQDLLNRGKDAAKLEDLPGVVIHETDEEVVLKGLEAHPSASIHEALNLLFLGDTNRLYCETPMNQTSSRSHCVFSVLLEAREHGTANVRRSKLNLVDLAGSERVGKTGVTGQLLTEARFINTSLHYLEQVIVALSEQSAGRRDHVPYRNSILTRVLRDSLGGNCRTVMLATGHPGDQFLMETVSTCRFAQRVASIKQHAEINEETDPSVLVRQLRAEVVQLKEHISFLEKSSGTDSSRELSADELERCRESISRFLKDSDPTATVEGVSGDYARIKACFTIMKTMMASGNTAGVANIAAGRPQTGPMPGTPPTGSPAVAASNSELDRKVQQLTVSLQQKENELSLLFAIVEKHNAPKASAQTQTGEAGGTSLVAAGPRDRPTAPLPVTPPQVAPASRSQMIEREEVNATQAALRGDYDIDALSDADLLKDRQQAFDAFRKSYRKLEQIERSKGDLQGQYGKAKALAAEVNGYSDQAKQLKKRIQQLRTERVLQGQEQPDEEEKELFSQLENVKKSYHTKGEELGQLKERIDHMHHLLQRSQDQLVKDFEAWFALRQKQVQMAGATAQPQAPPPPRQQQQQQVPVATSSLNQSVFSGGGAPAARTSSGSAFIQQQHQVAREQQINHQAAYEAIGGDTGTTRANPYAPQRQSTGDPEADAALAKLLQAREKMRSQLQ